VAIIDGTTYELVARAKEDAERLTDLPAPLAEAMRDNALFVVQELFASRVRAMSAMGYVASQLADLVAASDPPPHLHADPRRRLRPDHRPHARV
jgi:hypothetical protein